MKMAETFDHLTPDELACNDGEFRNDGGTFWQADKCQHASQALKIFTDPIIVLFSEFWAEMKP